MTYLNLNRLAPIDKNKFKQQEPFPWMNIQGLVDGESFRALCRNLPDISMFTQEFGRKRGYNQDSHNRWALQYRENLDIPDVWRQFIFELQGPVYGEFIRRMFDLNDNERFVLTMHWHYAARGCGVSPHVDASRKLGSHIFYLHQSDSWSADWGGQTLVLDDDGRYPPHSNPSFDDLREAAASKILDNHSFIFERTNNSWHGVRPLVCPENELRKVFIVVINRVTLQVMWRKLRGKDADGYPLQARACRS